MKKYLYLLMFLFCLAATFSFYACGEGGTDTGNPTTGGEDADTADEEQTCVDAGGEWIEFSDGCVDSCESQRGEDVPCTAALTMGCECGEDRCWNDETLECEDL
ncbi:MAG: hypothetical protein HY541_00550 [Deltaproteobacteria bacterium]|nr:hypothetical protein [Deltaproteobacteria bacterium]